jgi:hypothetical protein
MFAVLLIAATLGQVQPNAVEATARNDSFTIHADVVRVIQSRLVDARCGTGSPASSQAAVQLNPPEHHPPQRQLTI